MRRKLNALSIEDIIKILTFLDENPLIRKNEVTVKFDVSAGTLLMIIKNRETLEQKFQSNGTVYKKKSRNCTLPDMD